ncbi:hypothetical protein [Crateriforma conspicua]|uniref:Uncharacterized protein n=1 Tax=Crateriforma conspicua TaxID=2527996 RepID=A0A5C6FFT3_9PLAN|nr:hypothetical protein [Crateriforma conspicua]TWU59622.1 hypothetical protein V7x_55320 [Crateriforma conspicua]
MTDNLEYLLECARRGASPGSSGNEKNARRIVEAIMEGVIGLDADATEGIGELAKLIYDRGFQARNEIRVQIGPRPEDVHYLELRDEESGLRYYLEGQPLHAGDLVSVFTKHGWEDARYEWNYNEGSRPVAVLDEERAIRIEDNTPCRQPVV